MPAVNVELDVEAVDLDGLAATYTSSGASPLLNVTDTFQFRNTGKEFLHFKKSGAGDCTVTFNTPRTVEGLDIENPTVTVPATTGDVFVGPFDPAVFNTPGSILLSGFTVSEVTGLTVAVLQLPS